MPAGGGTALQTYTDQKVVAVGSRDAGRARAFADRFGIPSAYGSYAELAEDRDVGIVSIASPHSGHFEQAMQAIDAGRHVLVEKAFTRNAGEAEQVIEAARKRGVFLMEAMWTRFLPHIDVFRQVVASGLLGEVQTVVVTGASGAYGVLNTTVFARTPTTASVSGTRARLEIDGHFYGPAEVRLIGRDHELLDTFVPDPLDGGLCCQAAEAARCIGAGRLESDLMPLSETLSIMRVLDGVRRDLDVSFPGE
ncbi:Gfo/Idh/MocA family protein [Streptomyces sp. NPDC055815]